MTNLYTIHGIFPIPVYSVKRDSDLDSTEEKEIEDIIKSGIRVSSRHSFSNDSYIFNTKLKKIKEFCEQHIKIYVKEIIKPKEELDFYITQSWLNVTKPGESHHQHYHSNSIISGVFYIAAIENDQIVFDDPFGRFKNIIGIPVKEYNIWNSNIWYFPVVTNQLLLFPSWLTHSVEQNKKQTTNRISISFNTFVKGTIGEADKSTELILK